MQAHEGNLYLQQGKTYIGLFRRYESIAPAIHMWIGLHANSPVATLCVFIRKEAICTQFNSHTSKIQETLAQGDMM